MEKLTRKCPNCNKELKYGTKYSFKVAEKKNSLCKSCGLKNTMTDDRLKKMSEKVKGENNPMYGKKGELNPFFGKTHTEESKMKMRDAVRDYSVYKTDEFRQKMSNVTTGKNSGMYGKNVYSIWVEKYGVEVADKKQQELREKLSKLSTGENNPMYGKPSPNGSGNGWSGWYKGWFFRSIKELTYVVNVIERFNLTWESAENKNYMIEYFDYKGLKRNYFPDFIINKKYLVEIKPKKLFKSDLVIRKQEAALNFCKKNGLKYKLRSINNLTNKELIDLYLNGEIIFTERYDKKFKERYLYS